MATRRSRAVDAASLGDDPEQLLERAPARLGVAGHDVALGGPVAVGDREGGQLVPEHDVAGEARRPRPAPAARPASPRRTRSHERRRITPYRARNRTRRWSSRAAIAPDVRWIVTIVARPASGLLESRRRSASSSSWVGRVRRRAGGSGTVVVRTRARSASIAAADLVIRCRAGSVGRSVPIRTVGRTASRGSPSSAATAAASASPSGRRRPIAAHGSSGFTTASCTIRATVKQVGVGLRPRLASASERGS